MSSSFGEFLNGASRGLRFCHKVRFRLRSRIKVRRQAGPNRIRATRADAPDTA
jgi:hypothetical protein